MTATPHDALFKAVFSNPEHARGALQAAMPLALGKNLEWSTLAHCSGSFVDPKLSQHHTDLLFSTRWRDGGDALVYLLFEHQSSNEPRMAFRLLRYLVRIWERWIAQNAPDAALPVIMPMVLAHDRQAWAAPRSLQELLDVPVALRPALAPHLIQLPYVLDDLATIPDAALRNRAETALATAATALLKHGRYHPNIAAFITEWRDVLRRVLQASNGADAFAWVVQYLVQVNESFAPPQLYDVIGRELGPQAKDTAMTIAEQLIAQGKREGKAEGLEEGELRALRRVLLMQARKRFGEASTQMLHRIERASSAQLDTWIGRLHSATSLDELIAD